MPICLSRKNLWILTEPKKFVSLSAKAVDDVEETPT